MAIRVREQLHHLRHADFGESSGGGRCSREENPEQTDCRRCGTVQMVLDGVKIDYRLMRESQLKLILLQPWSLILPTTRYGKAITPFDNGGYHRR